MKQTIKVMCDYETTEKLDAILESRGLVPFDLEHLPFNEFLFVTEIGKHEVDEAGLRKSFPEIPDDRFKEAIRLLKKHKASSYDCKVTIKGNIMYIDDTVNVATIQFKNKHMIINHADMDLSEHIEDFSMETMSDYAKKLIEKDPTHLETLGKGIVKLFGQVMTTLAYMQLPKEYKEVIDISPRQEATPVTKNKKNKKKVTYIRNTIYRPVINKEKYADFMSSRTYTRHTEAWYQSGHWRTYKSGKKVWINPTVKKAKGVSIDNIEQIYKVR